MTAEAMTAQANWYLHLKVCQMPLRTADATAARRTNRRRSTFLLLLQSIRPLRVAFEACWQIPSTLVQPRHRAHTGAPAIPHRNAHDRVSPKSV